MASNGSSSTLNLNHLNSNLAPLQSQKDLMSSAASQGYMERLPGFSNKFAEILLNKDEDQYEHFKDSIYNFNRKGRSKDMVRSKFFDQKANELKDETKVSKIPAIEKTPEQNQWS